MRRAKRFWQHATETWLQLREVNIAGDPALLAEYGGAFR
jgi:hypothetical protein